jgi:hypothetical protein
MTQVTDRISSPSVVEMAKQRYETERKNKIPTVVVNLTSKGLVYPESHPLRKGYVNMRHMSAYDEDIIVNETYIKKGIMFDMLLAELITDDINIDDIAIADREGLIINAYILGYGNEYTAVATDPETGNVVKQTINLSELTNKEFKLIPDANGEFEYIINDEYRIKFKYINNHDVISKESDNKIISKFLKSVITAVNDNRSAQAIDDLLQYGFPPKESKKFRTYYADNSPSVTDEIKFKGENGDTFSSKFRFNASVFWS